MTWLKEEMYAAGAQVSPLVLTRLRSLGVDNAAMMSALAQTDPFPPVGLMQIEIGSGGMWQPSERGQPALVQPVRVGDELLDIVAWRSGDPLATYCRTGHAWALGADALNEVHDAWDDVWLKVYPSPLDWLAAGGDGLVILDWRAAELVELRMVERLWVPNDKFGRVLHDALLRAPRMPSITADSQGVRRAA